MFTQALPEDNNSTLSSGPPSVFSILANRSESLRRDSSRLGIAREVFFCLFWSCLLWLLRASVSVGYAGTGESERQYHDSLHKLPCAIAGTSLRPMQQAV